MSNEAELAAAFERGLGGCVVQAFVDAPIVTFDGLVDRAGRVVFSTSHAYDAGIMQVLRERLDGHYYSARVVPPALDDVGRRALAAFGLRDGFFHLEFFDTPGGYVGLEINLRPPGGFTTDMMNDAGDIDVYDLWARLATGGSLDGFAYERAFHTAHAGRRDDRAYRLDDAELAAALGPMLRSRRAVPRAFAETMGDTAYLLRDPNLGELQRGIALVQGRAS